jgi:hypothetical protein
MMSAKFGIHLRWLTPAEGGRAIPFTGNRYTPTARFAGEKNQFSVELEFSSNQTIGSLRLLNPEIVDIERRLHPGVELEIMEGSAVVARCAVEN